MFLCLIVKNIVVSVGLSRPVVQLNLDFRMNMLSLRRWQVNIFGTPIGKARDEP